MADETIPLAQGNGQVPLPDLIRDVVSQEDWLGQFVNKDAPVEHTYNGKIFKIAQAVDYISKEQQNIKIAFARLMEFVKNLNADVANLYGVKEDDYAAGERASAEVPMKTDAKIEGGDVK